MKNMVLKLVNISLRSFLCYIILLFLLPFDSNAAGINRRDLFGTGSDYTSILYDSSNGLPTSDANAVVQNEEGFIWIGSYSGLVRYDGSSFYRFDSKTGISSVYSLYVDSKDRVWIGTNENGFAFYDHGQITSYGKLEGMKSHSIRAICEDAEGNILIGTTEGLAYVDEDLEFHLINDPQVNSAYITNIMRSCDDRVYGLTKEGAVFEIKNRRVAAYYPPEKFGENRVNCIYPDPEDPTLLHMATTGSEYTIVDTIHGMRIKRRFSVSPLIDIGCIKKEGDLIWIAATNGIGYLDNYSSATLLTDVPMNNSVVSIQSDHEGNLWFASTRQGVMKLVPDRFTDLSKLADLDTMVVNTTCVANDMIYLGTDTGLHLINIFNYEEITDELTEMLAETRIRCILKDSHGDVWICTYSSNGLLCVKPDGTITKFDESKGLDSERIRDIIELSDGSMAVATGGSGLYLIKDGAIVDHYDQEDGLSNLEILTVEEGPSKELYIGTDGDGIYVLEDNLLSRISIEDGLTSGVVMRIKWDETNRLFWLVTSNSIEYIKDGNVYHISEFPYSNNFDIFFDTHGGAWILASNGLYITKTSELIANKDIQYSYYNTRSGLPYISTSNSRSYLDKNGKLYISGTTGVCAVNINQAIDNNDTIKLSIPSISIDGRETFLVDKTTIAVPAGSKRIDINPYAMTYGLNNPRISYYLEGFEKEPIYTTKQELSPVTYTNLDGGKYVFHLNVINDETGETDKSASITIIKEASLYENTWFWVVLTLIIVVSVAFAIWNHFQKANAALLAKQEADQKFINQIMHAFAKCIDLRDTQNRGHSFRVGYYTKLLATKLAEKRGYTKEQINEFYNIALLHDIGKLSIPDAILNKTERLNDEEYAVMKTHAKNGAEMLEEVSILKDFSAGAGCHHERIDGRGYPNGLSGNNIPEVARIIAVADTFDAMYSTRPYRKILDIEVVMEEIHRIRGTQLDAEVCDALFELKEEGELDRTKVDAAVFATQAAHASGDDNDKNDPNSGKTEDNESFQKSLGL